MAGIVARPVVGEVVDAAEAKGRSALVALGGVVVDHVEHHLDVGGVQHLHHGLELVHRVGDAVAVLGGEEADAVVAPIVGEAPVGELALVEERVHGKQLQRRHAERLQVLEHLRRVQARELAAVLRAHVGVQLGEAAHVHLVDDAIVARVVRVLVALPVEGRIDHAALRDQGRGVVAVAGQVVALGADQVAEEGVAPGEPPREAARVRIEQQLVGVEAMTLRRLVRAVYAIAVELPGREARHVAVPDEVGALAQREACVLAPAARVEQAQLDAFGVAREEREIDPGAIPGRAQRVGRSGPELQRGVNRCS